MKTNAPDRIYLQEPTKIRTERLYNNDVEYIRQDAFVEKACEWLENNAREYAFVDTDRIGNVADIDLSFVQDFKKYMKGE